LALESLVLKADGWVAGLVDAFLAEYVAIYELVKAGKNKGLSKFTVGLCHY